MAKVNTDAVLDELHAVLDTYDLPHSSGRRPAETITAYQDVVLGLDQDLRKAQKEIATLKEKIAAAKKALK